MLKQLNISQTAYPYLTNSYIDILARQYVEVIINKNYSNNFKKKGID